MSTIWERLEQHRKPINRAAHNIIQAAKPDDLPSECFITSDSAIFLEGFAAAESLALTDADQDCPYEDRLRRRQWQEGFEEGLYQHTQSPPRQQVREANHAQRVERYNVTKRDDHA